MKLVEKLYFIPTVQRKGSGFFRIVYEPIISNQQLARIVNIFEENIPETFFIKEKKRELPTVSFDYDDSVFQGVDEGPERALEKKENTETLHRLIKDLPPELRRVLELDQEGYSHREIAKMEGITEQIVERRYRSAARAIFGMLH